MKVNQKEFGNSTSGLKSARSWIVSVHGEKIDFEQDEKFAKVFANSFGIENGKPVATVEQV